MFGYVKPDKDNLLVKDLALYKATYCGLCAIIKKNVSFILPLTLSYDFVFLAMVRSALAKEKCSITKGRCKYNPLKRCAYSVCEKETLYTAESALILTTLKLEDDIADKDSSFLKKIGVSIFHRYLSGKLKKLLKRNSEYKGLVDSLRLKLKELRALENTNSTELDLACGIFGDIMAEITSFGFDNTTGTLAREIGSSIGRYIYLADAVDDYKKDEKTGAYNPLIAAYGSSEGVKSNLKEIDVAFSMFAKRAVLASELLDDSEYSRIINNVVSQGIGAEAYRIMTKKGDKNDRSL